MTRFARLPRRLPGAMRLALITLLALAAFTLLSVQPGLVFAASPDSSAPATSAPTIQPTTQPSAATSPMASATPAGAPCPVPTPNPSATPLPPGTTPAPHPLCPASLSGNPADLFAWLFNPIFQTLFLGLVIFYRLTGDIGIAIILLTLVIKTVLVPLFRAQIVSQRRMQMLQPEIKALQVKYKGNRTKFNEEQMRLYRERGVNPASGCLPSVLQLGLLLPIYQVFYTGLAAPNIDSALQFLGIPLKGLIQCQATGPCLDPTIHWLGNLPAQHPEILFNVPLPVFGLFGVSALAIFSAFLQLIQTRMATPRTSDPTAAASQRVMLFLPLISIVYGSFLPAGLFIYWIVFTTYSIVQQYLIAGWGSLFPILGWTPGFVRDHQPRFPVPPPKLNTPSADSGASRRSEPDNRSASDRAAGTIRPARQRGRTSRRGRRR
jgi:YidC/Oxa1 family membrane protein insertase